MPIETWFAFAAASAVLLAIPGPTILLVVGVALAHGRRAGLSTVPGVVVGDAVAMTTSLAGLGALLATSATAFTVLKVLGAAYLVWLGISTWRHPLPPPRPVAVAGPDPRHRRRAFVVTALNPKSIAFFVAFVPQFVDPDGNVPLQLAILEGTFLALAGTGAALYALAAGHTRRLVASAAARRSVARLGGSALVAAGAMTAAARQP